MDFTTPADAKQLLTNTPPDEARCPTCGQASRAYDAKLSGLLDMVLLLQSIVDDLKHAVEEGAL